MQVAKGKRTGGKGLGEPPVSFGEETTADHIVSRSERSESVTQELDALVIFDRGTRWIDAFPVRSRTADDVYNCFLNFTGAQQAIKYCYSDDSKELQSALTQLKIPMAHRFPDGQGPTR